MTIAAGPQERIRRVPVPRHALPARRRARPLGWGHRVHVGCRPPRAGSPFARRDERRTSPPLAGLGTALLGIVLGLDSWLGGAVRPVTGPGDVAITVATVLLFLGPVPAVAVAAHHGAGGTVRQFARGYVLLVGPALAVHATTPLFPDGWWLVGAVAASSLCTAAATPLLVAQVADSRPLSPSERSQVALPVDTTVRVLDARRATAFAAGLPPGPRVVFVTEGLLVRLPPAAAAAVIAHEVGHHRRHHVVLRLGAVGAFVLPWLGATAAGVPGAFPLGCVLAVPYGLGLVRLIRWTEHDADAFAARYADGTALAAGLRLLGDDHPRGPIARLLAPHPPPAERVRLMSPIEERINR